MLSIIAVAIIFHIWGVLMALGLLKKTFEAEKLAQKYGKDLAKSHGDDYNIGYKIKNRILMYVVCILFSWLAYSALNKLHGKPPVTKKNDETS